MKIFTDITVGVNVFYMFQVKSVNKIRIAPVFLIDMD